jgi:hypothetical protein
MERVKTTKPVVGVFGATGHTGRFVVDELLRREITPIAIARNPEALAAFPHFDVVRRQATVDDAASLDRALRGVQAVINCAGPFADTADAVTSAAMRAGIHYVDVCAEQAVAQATLDKFDEPARQAGVAVVPSVAFYGGFADLMVSAATSDGWWYVDSIEIMIGMDRWQPTRGTRVTVDRRPAENLNDFRWAPDARALLARSKTLEFWPRPRRTGCRRGALYGSGVDTAVHQD